MTYLTKMEMVENVPIRFYSLLWSLHIPSNIVAFVWRISLNKLPTKENLRKQGVVLNELGYQCSFCQDQEESVNHVLFTCRFATRSGIIFIAG